MDTRISRVRAREVLDSRGNPTLEAEVILAGGGQGRAMVPSGASTGEHEAVELRDGDPGRYGGKGVLRAVENVLREIAPALEGFDAVDQSRVDSQMIDLDGTTAKSRLGANAILAVSLAAARAAADARSLPLFRHLGNDSARVLPVPLLNILNGGVHSRWESADFQEFMIVPYGAPTFRESLRWGAEVYHALRAVLQKRGLATLVGDEGGFAPALKTNAEAIDLILQAIESAGYRPGADIGLALDPAASELFDAARSRYVLRREGSEWTGEELAGFWVKWTQKYPIVSLEDGLAEDDWQTWVSLNRSLGDRVQLVGDDLLVTHPDRVRRAVEQKACNALLVKVNQIGTLSEARQAIEIGRAAGWGLIASHRSGETEDAILADLAVGMGMEQIKSGAPARSERVAKYNRLLRIEEELGRRAEFLGRGILRPK